MWGFGMQLDDIRVSGLKALPFTSDFPTLQHRNSQHYYLVCYHTSRIRRLPSLNNTFQIQVITNNRLAKAVRVQHPVTHAENSSLVNLWLLVRSLLLLFWTGYLLISSELLSIHTSLTPPTSKSLHHVVLRDRKPFFCDSRGDRFIWLAALQVKADSSSLWSWSLSRVWNTHILRIWGYEYMARSQGFFSFKY
jgi:hypothetical protein